MIRIVTSYDEATRDKCEEDAVSRHPSKTVFVNLPHQIWTFGTPLSSRFQPFSIVDIAAQPWRNGGGQTHEIGAGRIGKDLGCAAWDWRVSVAEIRIPGAFSKFNGIERTAVLLAGAPLSLHYLIHSIKFDQIGDIRRFPGEAAVQCQPSPGGANLLNVMTVRGRAAAEVKIRNGHRTLKTDEISMRFFYVVSGEFAMSIYVNGRKTTELPLLIAGQGVQLSQLDAVVNLRLASSAGQLADISISAAEARPT